jgi:hypothetical protein
LAPNHRVSQARRSKSLRQRWRVPAVYGPTASILTQNYSIVVSRYCSEASVPLSSSKNDFRARCHLIFASLSTCCSRPQPSRESSCRPVNNRLPGRAYPRRPAEGGGVFQIRRPRQHARLIALPLLVPLTRARSSSSAATLGELQ